MQSQNDTPIKMLITVYSNQHISSPETLIIKQFEFKKFLYPNKQNIFIYWPSKKRFSRNSLFTIIHHSI